MSLFSPAVDSEVHSRQTRSSHGHEAAKRMPGGCLQPPTPAIGSRPGLPPNSAHAVGNQAMLRMLSRSHIAAPVLRRKCSCASVADAGSRCEQCRSESAILRRRAGGHAAPAAVPAVVHETLRSTGHPLDAATRISMEAAFGRDFKSVRIHTDGRAAQSAGAVDAHAYTVGRDIVFAAGRYDPQSSSGRRLLTHELAHVVQQEGSGPAAHQVTEIGRADDAAEAQADQAATAVMSMGTAQPLAPLSASRVLQRQPVSPAGKDPVGTQGQPTQAAPPMTRAQERALSITSPGRIQVGVSPPMVSLYNFAIDRATLKEEHLAALHAIAAVIKRLGPAKLHVSAEGNADSSGEDTYNIPLSRHRVIAVRDVLKRESGVPIHISWYGEDRPAVSNDTVDGRSRNRRVDIYFTATGSRRKPEDKHDHGGNGDGNGGGNGGGNGWHPPVPCEGFFGALICGLIACALAPEICLFCMENPEICLDWPKPKRKPPEKQPPKARKACPVYIKPIQSQVIDAYQTAVLIYPFDMNMVFKQEAPDHSPYCDCNCGEYRQYVRGFFERNGGHGPVKPQKHKLAHGKELRPDLMQEDGPDPYGHRYTTDAARHMDKAAAHALLKPNRDKKTDPQGVHDKYVPDRQDGCEYQGYDAPGMQYSAQDEEIHFLLEFRAGAIDGCNGNREVGPWITWTVKADRVPPTPPTTPVPKGGTGGGGGKFVKPRPSTGAPRGNLPWTYLGGLPRDPQPFHHATLDIGFESEGEKFYTEIDVEILVVSPSEVTVMTTNSDVLNVAPDGHPPILLRPNVTVTIPR